jgi:hypothetical protein
MSLDTHHHSDSFLAQQQRLNMAAAMQISTCEYSLRDILFMTSIAKDLFIKYIQPMPKIVLSGEFALASSILHFDAVFKEAKT